MFEHSNTTPGEPISYTGLAVQDEHSPQPDDRLADTDIELAETMPGA